MAVFITGAGIAPSLGKLASDYAAGDTVKIPVNGTNKEFLVVHQGLPSSDYDSSCNGTWLLMKDIYEKRVWDSYNNDYANSDIHSYLNGTFLNLLNNSTKNAIKQIKLPYWNGTGTSGSYQKGSSGLSTKVFLLSDMEAGFTSQSSSMLRIGAKLSYFETGTGTSAKNKRIAKLNGSATNWFFRSPGSDGNSGVFYVYIDGDWGEEPALNSDGVRPAFILDSSTKFDPDTNVIK